MYKLQLLSIGFLFLSITLTRAEPLPENSLPPLTPLITEKIVVSKHDLSIDDYIVALAQESGANIIMDVTNIPESEMIQPYPASPRGNLYPNPEFFNVVIDVTEMHQLALAPYSANTFLLQREPDAIALGQSIANKMFKEMPETADNTAELYSTLTKYQPIAMDFNEDELVIDFPFQALSEDQIASVTSIIHQRFLKDATWAAAWFLEDFWEDARIRLTQRKAEETEITFMQVMGQIHGNWVGVGLFGLQDYPEESIVHAQKDRG